MDTALLKEKLMRLDELQAITDQIENFLGTAQWERVKDLLDQRGKLIEDCARLDKLWEEISASFEDGWQQSAEYLDCAESMQGKMKSLYSQIKKHDSYFRERLAVIHEMNQELEQISLVASKYANVNQNVESRFFDRKE
ncbi:hypothetical protein [Effusibacillus dendaii]|uniref:Flagellar protein FliT n=1 Tax=Effusibacillus dendaii TaxID=2743772 RepID=A0A7I8DCX4_9BACL|nr:hypothetical protein [Effusibacillus dendaii]BCJ87877.1 hypothetical protein skT53_28620 [Effusibacillus dendaii]